METNQHVMHTKGIFHLLLLLHVLVVGCDAQPSDSPLKLVATIPLPEVKGRIDHLSFDKRNQTIFVAALGSSSVEVVDLKTKKVIYTIPHENKPQGIAFLPERNTVFVANGNGECDVFNAKTYRKISSIRLPDDADNVRYDAQENRIFVGYGSGGIAIIDAATYTLLATIPLSGHPESFQLDSLQRKIYVNVPDEQQVEVIDLKTNRVTGKWKLTEATANFPMSLDEKKHRLLIGCRRKPTLLVLDTQTGKTVSSFEIDRDVDDIFFNETTDQLYLSCGGGYVDVFKQVDANTYTTVGKVATSAGARTSLLIPERHLFIAASPSGPTTDASLLIYSTQ